MMLLVAVAACSTMPPASTSSSSSSKSSTVSARESTGETVTPDKTPAETIAAAVPQGQRAAGENLLQQAARAMADGNEVRAQALLQRAQRLDPSNPDIYLALANFYNSTGQTASGRAMAERGLLFCRGGDCELLRELASP
ncbi:MAG: tetratricopeptide repeat protein [Pseudomonadota bacterium]